EVRRRLVAEIVRTAAEADLQRLDLRRVADAVYVGILRRLLLPELLDIFLQRVDVGATLGAQLALEPPASEYEQARLHLVDVRGIEAVREIALEEIDPQVLTFDRHRLQLEAAVRTEVVVGHEVAGQLRFLSLFRARQRLRLDDVV